MAALLSGTTGVVDIAGAGAGAGLRGGITRLSSRSARGSSSLCPSCAAEPDAMVAPISVTAPRVTVSIKPLGDFSIDGDLDAILGRFEKAVLERLYAEHPSSRQLGKRLGVSHTTIANKLRQHGVGKD